MLLLIILTFSFKESSHNPEALGDKNDKGIYLAYGLFQFHNDRWKECSKEKRIGASTSTQINAFLKEIENYNRRYKTKITDKDWIIGFANYHNLGHKSTTKTQYVKDILKIYNNYKTKTKLTIKERKISDCYKN